MHKALHPVTYWPLTVPSIRDTSVNKQKRSRDLIESKWALWNNICRYTQQLSQLGSVRAESKPACCHGEHITVACGSYQASGWATPVEKHKKCKVGSWENQKLLVNIAICLVSLRPSVSNTTEASTPDERIKRRIYSNKEVLSFIISTAIQQSQRWRWQIMCQEKKVEEDLPVLKYQYNDLKTIYKSKEDWLRRSETILTTSGPTER